DPDRQAAVEKEDTRRTATSLLPTLPASQRSFLGSEPGGQGAHEVVHHVEVGCGVADSTRLLRSIQDSRSGLTGNRLRRLSILKGLNENHLRVIPLHFSDYLGEMRGRRSYARLRFQLV